MIVLPPSERVRERSRRLTAGPAIGAWTIHFVIIVLFKVFYDSLPGVSQETSWTLTNISYMFVCITHMLIPTAAAGR